MYSFETKIRVRYGETDQMSFAYYGVYAQYYEVGRVELLRSLDIPYTELEELGFYLPVVALKINYKKHAFYDEELLIRTTIYKISSRKVIFNYKTLNSKGDLLNTGEVVLMCVNKLTGNSCSMPRVLLDRLSE